MTEHTFESFSKQLQKLASKVNDRKINSQLARKCREILYRRVKNGYGVDSDRRDPESTRQVKLKPLSPSYIAYREGKVSFFRTKDGRVVPVDLQKYSKKNKLGKGAFAPKLGAFGRPRKSNATLTGDMLENIILKSTEDGFQLIISNDRREDGLTNRKVAEYYSKDRPFFALTAGEIRILTRELERIIQDLIDKNM
jgi:hypothetical protein